MFLEKQKKEIRKRLSSIPDLGHREEGVKAKLETLFDEICGLADTSERTQKETDFQNQLLNLENNVSYLKGRNKI